MFPALVGFVNCKKIQHSEFLSTEVYVFITITEGC